MKEYQVICIDDDEEFLASLENALPDKVERLCRDFGLVFDFVATPEELFDLLPSDGEDGPSPAMVISDQVMPGISGIDLVEKLKARWPELVCVLLTGHAGLDSAKYAINRSLLDQYVSKPIEDLHEFASLVANLLKRRHLDLEEQERTAQLAETVEQLCVSNENIRAMHAAAEQVAMLSKSFKSLDFDEVVQLATLEVPQIFHAEWSVLCFRENGCPVEMVRRRDCPCGDPELFTRQDATETIESGVARSGDVTQVCAALGAQSPDVVIPLAVSNLPMQGNEKREDWHGYLCMCHIDPRISGSADLMKYKGELVREILSANLTNAKLYQEARRQSQVDILTGVSTRRVLEEKLDAEFKRAVRYKHPFCVTIMDVDHFKSINDTFGHPAGDKVLRELARVLREETRAIDVFARYGGDEFVVLMPETELNQAVPTVERMRARAEAISKPNGEHVTISCGVTQWLGAPADNAANVLRRADAALYEAKRAGRNRVEIAEAA